MAKKKNLPIGFDDFRKIREQDKYFVDKSKMIAEFLDCGDEVALITRPRRFGKTLTMTMLREFFDITKDSRSIFEGLAIMDTEYAPLLNSRPVIYFTLKDCNAQTPEELAAMLCGALSQEYGKYYEIAREMPDKVAEFDYFEKLCAKIQERTATLTDLAGSVSLLEQVVCKLYGQPVILLLDEYDTPVMGSHQYGYHDKVSAFIANFYGSALKGQQALGNALLTGIQRVAKESIFSKLNNVIVYTVLDKTYAQYFGFTEKETREMLEYYGLSLNDDVKQMYDGYQMGGYESYNPWSILNYCKNRELRPYWVNTSSNKVIRDSLNGANQAFRQDFEALVEHGEVEVAVNLETSYEELQNNATLWGLFINAGYLTVKERTDYDLWAVRFVNREVKAEFKNIVAESIGTDGGDFSHLASALARCDYGKFCESYKKIVLNCTSYYDSIKGAKQYENPYHMLALGMMISLDSMYEVKSNLETGDGRPDILMISKEPGKRAHIMIEIKCREDAAAGTKEALEQIKEKRYAEGLRAMQPEGEILCLGIAHPAKRCVIERWMYA
ncbi:MAG: ATP-binding protein [Clostridiales bacterium]|nr:ATP-binding protein [Clostridiales bacterium]